MKKVAIIFLVMILFNIQSTTQFLAKNIVSDVTLEQLQKEAKTIAVEIEKGNQNFVRVYGEGQTNKMKKIDQSIPLTIEEEALLREKNMKSSMMSRSDIGAVAKSLPIRQHPQINGYYCGPASVRSAISVYNLDGKYSQTTLGTLIGTTTAGSSGVGIAKTLNQVFRTHGVLTKDWYVRELIDIDAYRNATKISDFDRKIKFDISWDQPVILSVNGQWPSYTYTAGHFITVYGHSYTSGTTYYHLTDSIAHSGIPNSTQAGMQPYRTFRQSDLIYAASNGSITW